MQIMYLHPEELKRYRALGLDVEVLDLGKAENIHIEGNTIKGVPICIDCGIVLSEFAVRCVECATKAAHESCNEQGEGS